MSMSNIFDFRNSCLDCLRGGVASSNGYLGFAARSMIDSMVMTCLARNNSFSSQHLFGWSSVQARIFQLASTCVATPWNDGSSTSIVNTLKRVAMRASIERDEAVSMAANEALRVCDLFGVPRAPPLVFVHRTVSENADRVETSAAEIIEDIQRAQVEATQARAAMEQAEKAKAQEKRQREAEREESSKRKREEREKRKEAPVLKEPPSSSASPLTADKSVEKRVEQETTKITQKNPPLIEKESKKDEKMEVDNHACGEDEGDPRNKEMDSPNGAEESDGQIKGEEVGDEELDEDFPDIVAGGPDSDDD